MGSFFKAIKKHKILSIVVLSVIVLTTGAFVAFKIIMNNAAKAPEMEASPEFFEYETIDSLKEVFAVSDEEKARSIDSYSENESFAVYKRAFYNFITTDKYRVVTTGQTNVDTMGGITVNIENEKKFDGKNFYMHLKSSAAVDGVFANMSNNNAMHYLYVTGDNSKNLATIKNLDVNDPSIVKRKDVLTEKDYVYNYGAIPYTACNFTIRENTVTDSFFSFDAATGLYKLEMRLDPVESTKGLVRQMHAVSGTDASYENGSVTYTAYVDDSFLIRRADIKESYKVSTLGLNFNGVAETSDAFFYEGNSEFSPLSENEKYDLTDVPVEKDDAQDELIKEISKNAVGLVKAEGVNADFVLSVKDVTLSGRLQVKFENGVTVRIDSEVNGLPISVYLALDQAKAGTLIANVDGISAGIEFDNIGDTIVEVLDKFGVDLKNMPISTIIENIDLAELIDAFGNITGKEISANVYEFEPNLKNTGIPLDVPFKMLVENGKIASFKIDHTDVLGTEVYFSLTPSAKAKDLTKLSVGGSVADLSGVIDYVLNNVDFDNIFEIIEKKNVTFDIAAEINGFTITGNVAADFTELAAPVIKADLNIDGMELSVFFSDGTVFVKSGSVAVTATVEDITDYVSVFTDNTLDLSSVTDDLTANLFTIINSVVCAENQVSVYYDDLSLTLSPAKISIDYNGKISAEISNIAAGDVITALEGDFVNLTGLKPLLQKINDQLSTRYFTANGSINIGDTAIRFENVKIVNEGNLKDPTEAFDNGDLTLSGTLYITSGDTTHKLFIQYINSYLFVAYNNDMKIKMSRASLDYVVDLIKNNYKAIIQRFNYSEILSADDTLGKLKDYEFTIGSVMSLLQNVSVENGAVSLTVNASDFGFNDSAVMTAYINEENLALALTVGDKNGNISLDNTPFNKPAAPTGSYVDLSGINGLAKAAVNAILKPSEEYYLSGSARVVIPIVLINIDVNISMDASVRLVPDGNGGKTIEAVAHVSCYDTTVDTSLARSYLKCGDGTLVYKNDTFYITRVNKQRKNIFSSSWTTKSTERRAMTRDYFGANIMSQLGFFMGLGEDILSTFTSGGNAQPEKCLKSYTASGNTHTIVLDGKALSGSNELGNMTLAIGITNEQLTSLNVTIPISLSIVNMTATVNLTHDPAKAGNFTDANNLNPSLFGSVLHL